MRTSGPTSSKSTNGHGPTPSALPQYFSARRISSSFNQQTLVAAASYFEPHLVCFARMGTNRPDGLVSNLTALVSLVSHSVFMVLTLPIYLSLRSQWVRGPVQIEILAFQGAPTS